MEGNHWEKLLSQLIGLVGQKNNAGCWFDCHICNNEVFETLVPIHIKSHLLSITRCLLAPHIQQLSDIFSASYIESYRGYFGAALGIHFG